MSFTQNLTEIKDNGIEEFLKPRKESIAAQNVAA